MLRYDLQFIWPLLLWILPSYTTSADSAYEDGTQFIYYNGTIHGSYVLNGGNVSDGPRCGPHRTYYFANLTNSLMRIGIHPPWDTNPFFFELAHFGNEWQDGSSSTAQSRKRQATDVREKSQRRGKPLSPAQGIQGKRDFCVNPFRGCTYDSIYNLQFDTAWSNGQMVNLSAASVSIASSGIALSNDDGAAFYSVSGDEKTWISNGTVHKNTFDFQIPKNYTYDFYQSCDNSVESTINWNDGQHMTYSVNFTNNTSISEFSITTNKSTVTMFFSGTRDDGDPNAYDAYVHRPSDGTTYYNTSLNTIALADPMSYPLPHFTFADGTGFHFSHSDEDGWVVKRGASMSLRDGLSKTIMWWALFGSVVTLLLW